MTLQLLPSGSKSLFPHHLNPICPVTLLWLKNVAKVTIHQLWNYHKDLCTAVLVFGPLLHYKHKPGLEDERPRGRQWRKEEPQPTTSQLSPTEAPNQLKFGCRPMREPRDPEDLNSWVQAKQLIHRIRSYINGGCPEAWSLGVICHTAISSWYTNITVHSYWQPSLYISLLPYLCSLHFLSTLFTLKSLPHGLGELNLRQGGVLLPLRFQGIPSDFHYYKDCSES